eukprot:RCo042734
MGQLVLLLRPLCVAVRNDLIKLVLLLLHPLDLALLGFQLGLQGLDVLLQGLHLLLRLLLRAVLLQQGLLLDRDLLLELVDLVVHDLELSLHLIDLVAGLDEILGVQVAVRAHGLVEGLLLLQLCLALCDLLLQVRDCHGADLHLLQGSVVLHRCLAALRGVLLAVLLQLVDVLALLLGVLAVGQNLHLKVLLLPLHNHGLVNLLVLLPLGLDEVLVQDVALTLEILNGLLVLLDLFLQNIDLALVADNLSPQGFLAPLQLLFVAVQQLDLLDLGLLLLPQLGLRHLVALNIALLHRQLRLELCVNCQQAGVHCNLLFQGHLVLLQPLLQGLEVLEGLLRTGALLLKPVLQPRHVLDPLLHKCGLRLDVRGFADKHQIELLQLFLIALPLLGLGVELLVCGPELLLHLLQLVLQLRVVPLQLLVLFHVVTDLMAETNDLGVQSVPLLGQLVFDLNQLIHGVLLANGQASTLLHELAEVGDLLLQLLDGFLGAALLLVRRVHHLPGLLDLLLQAVDGVLVLLGKLQRGLDLAGIGDDLAVQLLAFLD